MNALRYGVPEAARMNQISKGRVSQIFKKHKGWALMDYEMYDEDGTEKSFIELRKIFNQGI